MGMIPKQGDPKRVKHKGSATEAQCCYPGLDVAVVYSLMQQTGFPKLQSCDEIHRDIFLALWRLVA